MSDLNTEIEGEVASIQAVGTWLRSDLGPGMTGLADTVSSQRTAARGDWEGEAGTAFAGRAGALATAANDGAVITGEVATAVDVLAAALQTAQSQMLGARLHALQGDLVVHWLWIRNPGAGPPSAGATPGAGASQAAADAWDQAEAAVAAHNGKVVVWDECVTRAATAFDGWQAALETAGSTWSDHDSQYVGVTAQLLSAGVQLEVIRRTTPVLVGEVDRMLAQAATLRDHADALVAPDGTVSDPARYYDLLDEADRLDDAHPAARSGLSSWELPQGLTRGLWVLDVAAAGYGIHSDWEEEGPAQAITSNVMPAAASIASGVAAGATAGAVIGSFIPVPGVGTAAGVVVGAGVGLVVGAFTSGAIDSLFDSGADSLGDWGDAVGDGLGEIGDTAGGLVDGAGDVFDSIF
ncbi:MAG: hypothetical protein LH468_03540 [Nocardioides sp.]|nr:hypothetical protein [Nocardioides sp.]